MSLERRSVLIPLVAGDGGPGPVIHVEAGIEAPPAHPADLDPAISNLANYGLYQAGLVAQGSVARIAMKLHVLALAQRLRPSVRDTFLTITNAPEVGRLEADNSGSAELGLAIAFLMHAGQSKDRQVIATGCLSRETSIANSAMRDVSVRPVGGIPGKIAAIERNLAASKEAATVPRVTFFLPERTLDGLPTVEAYSEELDRLKSKCRERGIEIAIAPVNSLREATEKLGITALATSARDRFYISMVAGLSAAVFATSMAWSWLQRPLPLNFSPVAITDGGSVQSPVRARFDTQESAFQLEKACIGDQGLPVFRDGDSLVFRLGTPAQDATNNPASDHHYLLVTVAEETGIKVFPPETIGNNGPTSNEHGSSKVRAEDFGATLPVTGPHEKNKLIILARRLLPFSATDIRQKLETLISGRSKSERINSVVTYLTGRYPGYLDYSFLSTSGDLPCNSQ